MTWGEMTGKPPLQLCYNYRSYVGTEALSGMVSSSVQCELSLIQSVLGLSNKRTLLLRHVEAANTSNFRSGGPGFKPRLQTRNFTPLFYFIQVFNWVPATYCLGVTLRWTRIRPRGKQQYSYAYFMLRKPEISSSRVCLWLVCAFTHCTLLLKYREIVFFALHFASLTILRLLKQQLQSVFFHTFPECGLDASQRVVTSAVHIKPCCWATIIS